MFTPEQIGRYQIRERIGSGGFATVWLAYDGELQNNVAVKILAENWIERTDIQERFLEEARILRRADADGVVRVYDIGRLPDGRPYFVMSYGDGGTLAAAIEFGPLPVDKALEYAAETASGVAVLHDVGVIHRDIKPSNILIRISGQGARLMVADLGLAKEFAHASGFTVAAGTPGYMSPEQATVGGGLDQRSDVYSLGAVTYQLLTGRRPAAVATGSAVPPPSVLRPELPPGTDAVVMRAIAVDRASRWPDARQFAEALGQVLARHRQAGQLGGPAELAGTPVAAAALPTQGWSPTTPTAGTPWAPGRPQATNTGTTRTDGRRRALLGVVAGASAVVLVLVAGLVYWQLRPVTISSKDNSVSAQIPHEWGSAATSRSTQVEASTFDYGVDGTVILLDSGRTKLTQPGVTVVAGRALGKVDPEELLEYSTFPDSDTDSCKDPVPDMYPPDDEFNTGTVWTYTSCGKQDLTYVRAVLLSKDKSYGAQVFLTAKAEADPTELDEVLESITVDGAKLPEGG